MDIAELGLVIRSDGVVVAKDRLRDLEGQAVRTEKAGALMAKAFAVLTAAFSVSKLIDYTNRWTDLSSRVEIATGSIGAGAATMQRLSEMARRTYSSLDQTAEGFLLNATAMREMGATTGQTLDYVEALNNAMVVSGAKGDRAASVMNALGKAMALGKLSGDNLNTVISTGGRVAEALAESMGVTTLELRALGAAGKITSKDILGITSQLEKLREEADSMPATIGDAFTLLGNSILTMVGQFDQARDGSSRVAEAIIWVADAMNTGAISVERLLGQVAAFAVFMGAQYVMGLYAATGATNAFSFSLGLLRVALIRTGIGALVVIAGELVYQLWNVVDGSNSVAEGFGRIKKSGIDTWERIVSAAKWFEAVMNQISDNVVSYLSTKWAELVGNIAKSINMLQDAMGIQILSHEGMGALNETWISSFERAAEYSKSAEEHGKRAEAHWAAIFEDKNRSDGIGTMTSFGEIGATLGKPGTINLPPVLDKGAAKAAEKYKDLVRGAHEFVAAQQLEALALGMTAEAANRMRYEQDMLNQAANDNIKLTPKMREEIGGLAQAMAAAEEATRRRTEIYSFGKDVFTGFFGDLKSGITEGKSLWESLGNAATNALDKIADKALSMAANGIFDMIFGAVMGGIGGGMGNSLGGGWGVAGGFGKPGIFGIPGFADGTNYAPGGMAWVGERGPELVNLPRGAQVIPNGPSMALASNGNGSNDNAPIVIHNHIQVVPGATEEDGAAFARGVTKELKRQLPDAIKNYNNNNLRRTS
jgi:tape measure domain-containing protein